MNKPLHALRRAMLLALLCAPFASHTLQAAESLVQRLLRISGLAAAPGQLRGSEDEPAGSLWVGDVGTGTLVRWTQDSLFRSPVFAATGNGLYALLDAGLVHIASPGAAPVVVHKTTGVQKLVGFDKVAPDELIVLLSDGATPLASLSLKSGVLTPLPFDRNSADMQRLLGQIRSQDRASASTRVSVRTQSRQGLSRPIEWTDIIVQQGSSEARNLSRCDGLNCSQPALSADAARVVYVKAE